MILQEEVKECVSQTSLTTKSFIWELLTRLGVYRTCYAASDSLLPYVYNISQERGFLLRKEALAQYLPEPTPLYPSLRVWSDTKSAQMV